MSISDGGDLLDDNEKQLDDDGDDASVKRLDLQGHRL